MPLQSCHLFLAGRLGAITHSFCFKEGRDYWKERVYLLFLRLNLTHGKYGQGGLVLHPDPAKSKREIAASKQPDLGKNQIKEMQLYQGTVWLFGWNLLQTRPCVYRQEDVYACMHMCLLKLLLILPP